MDCTISPMLRVERGGVNRSAHGDARLRPGALREGNINFGEALAARAAVADVVIHADDLPGNGWAEFGDAGN